MENFIEYKNVPVLVAKPVNNDTHITTVYLNILCRQSLSLEELVCALARVFVITDPASQWDTDFFVLDDDTAMVGSYQHPAECVVEVNNIGRKHGGASCVPCAVSYYLDKVFGDKAVGAVNSKYPWYQAAASLGGWFGGLLHIENTLVVQPGQPPYLTHVCAVALVEHQRQLLRNESFRCVDKPEGVLKPNLSGMFGVLGDRVVMVRYNADDVYHRAESPIPGKS